LRRSELAQSANNGLMHCGKRRAQIGALFNHFVGVGERLRWHVEAERLRRLQIYHQLEFRRLLDRQVGGLLAV
jgi:hypothetical protein